MTTATLRNLGGSVVVTLPKKVLKLIHADAGTQVEINIQSGKLIIEPRKNPKYTLKQLLSQCNAKNMRLEKEDIAWVNDKPKGKELI